MSYKLLEGKSFALGAVISTKSAYLFALPLKKLLSLQKPGNLGPHATENKLLKVLCAEFL